jgi:hypothetical protein
MSAKNLFRLALLGVTVSTALGGREVASQSSETRPADGKVESWRVERSQLDPEYAKKIQEYHDWTVEKGLEPSDTARFKNTLNRDLWRQTIFIPADSSAELIPIHTAPQAFEKLDEVNDWQAERLFDLAKRAADAGAGGPAIQFLNEALFFNPNHTEIRRILAHQKTDTGWALYPDRLEIRKGTRPHDICPWSARSFSIVTTSNFQIESNAPEDQLRALAEKLERWHYVWRQIYFDYWSNARTLRRWMGGEGTYSYSRRRFKVIIFQNREDYLQVLTPLVPGVKISTGYYSNAKNISFFYFDAEDPSVEDTWKHELTHQLFRESIGTGTNLKPFENEYIWFDEGAATYAESLVDFGDYITLGGFDANRMQYARVRMLLENYQVPLKELNQLGRNSLQQRSDIVRLYGQIAGQFDMLMNDRAGASEAGLIEILKLLYRGKPVREARLEKTFGKTLKQLDERYRDFLIVDAERVEQHLSAPFARSGLSFAKSQLTDGSFEVIGQCHNLTWLDLSVNQIKPPNIHALAHCQSLRQLILTQCRLAPGTLRAMTELSALEEIDLSGSSVTDQQLLELQGQTNLKQLSVKSTHLTPAGITKLKQLLPSVQVVE